MLAYLNIKNKLRILLIKTFFKNYLILPRDNNNNISYSQAGEDRILNFLFESMKINQITYLDLGTNHPTQSSNTFFFYQNGSRGVCVEADPSLIHEIRKVRPSDECLNVGVTFDNRKEADFFILTSNGLSTLSKDEAEFRESAGSMKIDRVIKIPLKNINEIISENFNETPTLISIDLEGIDLQILQSLDYSLYRPLAICVETIHYSEQKMKNKIEEIFHFLKDMDYFVYADTYINTIFVDKRAYKSS